MIRTPQVPTIERALIVACILLGSATAAHAQQTGVSDTTPRLRNASKLTDVLNENYPLPLRNAAIGGEARIRFRVDEEGKVDSTWVAFSSGVISL